MKMNGSEKQIRWAEDIKSTLLPEIDELESELRRVQADTNMDSNLWRELNSFADDVNLLRLQPHDRVFIGINAIKNCNSAKWFIDYGRRGARESVHAAISGNYTMGGLI